MKFVLEERTTALKFGKSTKYSFEMKLYLQKLKPAYLHTVVDLIIVENHKIL